MVSSVVQQEVNRLSQAGKTFRTNLFPKKNFLPNGQTRGVKSCSKPFNVPSVWPLMKPASLIMPVVAEYGQWALYLQLPVVDLISLLQTCGQGSAKNTTRNNIGEGLG